jgi:hypothetical protein
MLGKWTVCLQRLNHRRRGSDAGRGRHCANLV